VGFWRKEVIEPALDEAARREITKQIEWIRCEPANARPYYHLAQFYRTLGRQEEALGLLLESVRLDPALAAAHVSLAEIYSIRADYAAAWRHARAAQSHGDASAVALLTRHKIAE
jgi:tetratricopeptide (TPR) repeat protein